MPAKLMLRGALRIFLPAAVFPLAVAQDAKIEDSSLLVAGGEQAGTYTIQSLDNPGVRIAAGFAAEVNHRWLGSADYPRHEKKPLGAMTARRPGPNSPSLTADYPANPIWCAAFAWPRGHRSPKLP